MTTPINARDIALQQTVPRVLGIASNYITIVSPNLEARYGADNLPVPSILELTVVMSGSLQGTPYFEVTGLLPNTQLTLQNNKLLLNPQTFAQDSVLVTAKLDFEGVTYTSVPVTAFKTFSAVTARLSRNFDLVQADSNGNSYVLPAANFLELFNGTNKLTAGVTFGPLTQTKFGLTCAVNSTTGQITLSQSAPDTWTSDYETFTLTATRNFVAYTVSYTVSKVREGGTGIDLTPPPTPTGFTATAGINTVLIQHDQPVYTQGSGHSHTVLYGRQFNTGDLVTPFNSADKLAEFTGTVYTLPSKFGSNWRLWIKWVSKDGGITTVPAGGTNGLVVQTGLVGSSDLSDAIITAAKIVDGSINLGGSKITGLLANANMAVITDPTKIADSLISNTKLAALAVTAEKIASGAIQLTKFASGIEPVTIATGSLPTTKSTETLTFNGKLYRWNGTAYVATIPTSDLTGTITDAQVAGLAASKITGQLTNAQIADLAATKVTGQLTNAQIADVAAAKLTGQITSTQITDDAISTPKLAAGAITAAKIAANTIVASNIAAGAITATEIATGTITSAKIASNTIVANNIAAGTITGTEIAAGAITAAKIAAGTIQASNIAAGTITGDRLLANTITSSQIAADTITAAQIAAGAITASELAAGAITAGKIAAGAIVAGDGVIGNAAITSALIANLAVGSAQIADSAITSAKIGVASIGAAAIQDLAVTNAKIANLSIDSAKIADLAVTNAKIGNLAVDDAKISSLNATKITAGFINADRIQAGSIAAGKLSVTDLSAVSSNMGTITAGKMQSADGRFVIDLTNKFISITV
jgi:hypothetical protein